MKSDMKSEHLHIIYLMHAVDVVKRAGRLMNERKNIFETNIASGVLVFLFLIMKWGFHMGDKNKIIII